MTLPQEDASTVAEGAGLAHDAGNLLGALRLYGDLLARPGVLREEHRHYAEELRLLGGRSGILIDRLLRPAATGEPAARAHASTEAGFAVLPEVIAGCRGLLETIAGRPLRVVIGEGSSAPIAVNGEVLERILVNLTKNAAEATSPAGAITLRVKMPPARSSRWENACVVLSVEDQGPGMNDAAAGVLLGRKGAAAAAVRVSASSPTRLRGLGLRVVRELVVASGAELRLDSGPGRGTTIEVGWRLAARPVASVPVAPPTWEQPSATATAQGKGRIAC